MNRRCRALVADSDDQSARVLRELLESLGVDTIRAEDGREALRLMERPEPPHLVVAQIALASLDGYALSSLLREKESTRSIPIVLVGVEHDRKERLAALRAGADEFLALPLDQEEVRLRLAALLRRLRPSSQNGRSQHHQARASVVSPSSPEELYGRALEEIRNVLQQVESGEPLRPSALPGIARELVQATETPAPLLRLALGPREALDWAAHQLNTSILAVTVARELELPEDRLRRLALTALVHDLGMLRVPSSLLEAPRRLTASELAQVKKHPLHTYEILRGAGSDFEDVARLALQEHERESGRGYPRGLRGTQIDELAKILGAADVFEACTHARPYAKTLIPYQAVQELLEMRDDFFHARYIKALLNALTVYPIGSFVLLNTGEIARVIATRRKNLMRPEVEVLYDPKGLPFRGSKKLDLSQLPFLFVSRPLSPDQLPEGSVKQEASPSP